MQSLFKSKKKRDSHNKSADDGSSTASHEYDQRSPSGASAKSSDSPLKSGKGAASNAPSSGLNAFSSVSNSATGAVSGAASHLPQNVQQQAQHQAQNVQNGATKVLNSPFMGSSQQGQNPGQFQQPAGRSSFHNQFPGQSQPGQPGQHLHGSSPQGMSPQGMSPQGMSPQGMSSRGMSPQVHSPQGMAAQGQQYPQQQFLPQNMQHGQPLPQHPNGQHVGALPGSPASASSPGSPSQNQARGLRQQNDPSISSPLAQQSETPWAEHVVQRAAPSPRFGHSANYLAARDGELFIMGGIRDMDILNDLWVIDTNSLTGYQLVTDGFKVGPRVGHASLVLGNAHVVFGGDTKIEEYDPLDDNLYLLNTSSLKWTVAQPQGPRPTGRYGHSMSNVGARVYVFGGQVDEEFYDDMWAFDLTNWRSPNAKWEKIQPITTPPPPRTNHTVVTYKDKLFLFGGANGDLWYSDTWCFDPATRAWEQLECSGYVPAPCQGHAATIIEDVMYVFGGMSSQGVLIDQLFALKLTTLKWYTFQNLGPGPSPRSGHSLTAFGGDKILVWGGTDQGNSAYVLDVSRINYPEDQSTGIGSSTIPEQSPIVPDAQGVTSRDIDSNVASGPEAVGEANPAHAGTTGVAGTAIGAAAGATGAAAGTAALSQSQNQPPEVDEPNEESSIGEEKSLSGPTTTKEVRELQPHVYAPQSIENSGPTQARSNSAARNSMLFSKRRSVMLPSSPIKELRSNNLDKDSTREENDSTPSTNTGQLSVDQPTRSPNRESGAQIKSYVTEPDSVESHEDRFVSAVDLPEGSHLPASGSVANDSKDNYKTRSHSRGLSFGTSTASQATLPEEEERKNPAVPEGGNDAQFRKMENQLDGMPGGMPSIPGSFPVESSPNGPGGITSDDSVKSGLSAWNNESRENLSDKSVNDEAEDSSRSTPGIRRSQPQTNLALQSIDGGGEEEKRNTVQDAGDISNVAVVGETSGHSVGDTSAPEAGLIGLSDQMSSLHTDSPNTPRTRELSNTTAAAGDAPERTSVPAAPNSADTNGIKNLEAKQPSVLKNNTDENAGPVRASSPPVSSSRDLPGVPSNNEDIGIGALGATGAAGVSAELASLKKQVDAYRQRDFDNEHHELKMSHAQLQRELAGLKDSNGQLTRKHASIVGHNSDLKQRYDQLEKVMDDHIATLRTQQAALEEANAKIRDQQQELAEMPALRSENADLKMKLKTAESAQKHAEEQLAAINNSYGSLKSAHSDLSAKHLAATTGSVSKDPNGSTDPHTELNSNVAHLLSVWDQFKLPAAGAAGAAGSRGLGDAGNNEEDGYRSLYETQKNAADQAHRQLEAAYKEQVTLKNQLRELSAVHSASPSTADIDMLKEQHNTAFTTLSDKHQASLRDLQQHASSIEDLRARLQKLETQHSELQGEYQKAISMSRNQQVALTKTREELNMSRAHAQRLEEQLEDASVQNSSLQADHTAGADGDMSHTSVSSARNDQAAMVIRDLRAQVVILEEEMQNQREQIMRLKKAALNH